MPLMVYEFVKGAMKRYSRPVTTDEVINYTKDVLPMCVDHVAHHLVEIYRKGLVKGKLDPERKGYVWWIEKPESVEVLAQKYPELFLESVYYHRVSKVLSPEKPNGHRRCHEDLGENFKELRWEKTNFEGNNGVGRQE